MLVIRCLRLFGSGFFCFCFVDDDEGGEFKMGWEYGWEGRMGVMVECIIMVGCCD